MWFNNLLGFLPFNLNTTLFLSTGIRFSWCIAANENGQPHELGRQWKKVKCVYSSRNISCGKKIIQTKVKLHKYYGTPWIVTVKNVIVFGRAWDILNVLDAHLSSVNHKQLKKVHVIRLTIIRDKAGMETVCFPGETALKVDKMEL